MTSQEGRQREREGAEAPVTHLGLSDIREPPYDVLVTVRAHVSMLEERLAGKGAGAVPPVIVAELDGTHYPVGNLDALRAHRNAGSKTVACQKVTGVRDMAGVLEAHLACSRSRAYDPVAMLDAVNELAAAGSGGMGAVPAEYRRLSGVSLSGEARKVLSEFMARLGRTQDDVPSMMHVVKPLSRVPRQRQADAASKIVSYSASMERFVSPDPIMVRRILAQYDGDGGEDFGSGGKTVSVAGMVAGTAAARAGGAGNGGGGSPGSPRSRAADGVDVATEVMDAEMGGNMPAVSNTVVHRCDGCSRRYMVSLKNGTIRRLVEEDSTITAAAEEEDGSVPYVVSARDAEFLELNLQPTIRSYRIGGSDTGHTVILTKRRLTRAAVAAIGATIHGRRK